jgi:hypothetical protein
VLLGHQVLWTPTATLIQELLAAKRDLAMRGAGPCFEIVGGDGSTQKVPPMTPSVERSVREATLHPRHVLAGNVILWTVSNGAQDHVRWLTETW